MRADLFHNRYGMLRWQWILLEVNTERAFSRSARHEADVNGLAWCTKCHDYREQHEICARRPG